MNSQFQYLSKTTPSLIPVPAVVLQRAAIIPALVHDVPPSVHEVLRSPGHPLDAGTRAFMEPRFGYDFSGVRIHTDERASQSAKTMNALAYTVGRDVIFDDGRYSVHTGEGLVLLAHELTHVMQQAQGLSPITIQRQEPERPTPVIPVTMPFNNLPEDQLVSDPTGRAHNIRIKRRGDELFYHLPPPLRGERKVPRPQVSERVPNIMDTIKSVKWGGGQPYQSAFEVSYENPLSLHFTVNIFGEGRLGSLLQLILPGPPALEIHAEGMEQEFEEGTLSESRPAARRFEDSHRYHMPGATYSMYLFPNRRVEVVDDISGRTLAGPWDPLVNLKVSPNGDVSLTWRDPVGMTTVRFDLRGPELSLTGLGVQGTSVDRVSLLEYFNRSGILIIERGSRFTETELRAAKDVLDRWRGPQGIVDALRANRIPSLKLIKDVLNNEASYNSATGEVKIPGDVEASPNMQRNTIIHELTHALFQARGLLIRDARNLPENIKTEARILAALSQLGQIDEYVIDPQKPSRTPRTEQAWERTLSSNPKLNNIWRILHYRFNIGDPELTGDIRGMDLADESRYLGGRRGDVVGHGFDNVSEFISSFVASSLHYQQEMSQTIERSGSLLLVQTYLDLWEWVNANLINLGNQNPFSVIRNRMSIPGQR